MKPTKIELMPFGLSVSFKLHINDYNKKIFKANLLELKKIIVAMSGPIVNLLIVLIIGLIDMNFEKKDIVIYSNLLIMLFNLLPIYPLDGGRILKSIIHIFYGGKCARILTNKIANYLMVIITAIGSVSIYYFKNIAIFIIIIFLWRLVIIENKKFAIIINAYER